MDGSIFIEYCFEASQDLAHPFFYLPLNGLLPRKRLARCCSATCLDPRLDFKYLNRRISATQKQATTTYLHVGKTRSSRFSLAASIRVTALPGWAPNPLLSSHRSGVVTSWHCKRMCWRQWWRHHDHYPTTRGSAWPPHGAQMMGRSCRLNSLVITADARLTLVIDEANMVWISA